MLILWRYIFFHLINYDLKCTYVYVMEKLCDFLLQDLLTLIQPWTTYVLMGNFCPCLSRWQLSVDTISVGPAWTLVSRTKSIVVLLAGILSLTNNHHFACHCLRPLKKHTGSDICHWIGLDAHKQTKILCRKFWNYFFFR